MTDPVQSALSTIRREKYVKALDAYANVFTGAGTSKDRRSGGGYVDQPVLSPYECAVLLKDNDLAIKIVGRLVDDGFRQGFDLRRVEGTPAQDHKDAARIVSKVRSLLRTKTGEDRWKRAAKQARGLGGAGLVLGVTDGLNSLEAPLDEDAVQSFDYIFDFDRREMEVATWYPNGQPLLYRYRPAMRRRVDAVREFLIHESRILLFPGAPTGNEEKDLNDSWDHSVLQASISTLMAFDAMFSSVDAMFNDASQVIFKLKGLLAGLAEDGSADAETRLALMDMMRSTSKAIFLDAGDNENPLPEDCEIVERTTLGQLTGVMGHYFTRISATADQPTTVFFGTSPGGMNATGESDMALWFGRADTYRRDLEEHILLLCRLVHRSLGVEGDPYDWTVVWPELQKPKPVDVHTSNKMAVEAAVTLANANIVLPEEVALSLRQIAPTLGLTIDVPSRVKALKEALEELESREMTGPTEVPESGAMAPPEKSSARQAPSKAQGRQAE